MELESSAPPDVGSLEEASSLSCFLSILVAYVRKVPAISVPYLIK